MLYDQWCEVARDGGDAVALVEAESGRRWTFAELFREGQASAPPQARTRVTPRGTGPDFVLEVLRGWRHGAVVCPLEEGQAEPPPGPLPAGCVHLKTTSATTGLSRQVAFSARQLLADAEQIVLAMGLKPAWPNLAAISLAHSYGFSNLVLPLLLHGIPLVLCGSGLPEAVRRGAACAQETTLAGVPVLWRTWLEAGAIAENVRLAISAGAPLPLGLEHDVFGRHGLKVHNFYGATECGGIAYDGTAEPREEEAFAGEPMPGVTLSLTKDRLVEVCSAAVGQGYWPEPTAELQEGVYRTTDLARIEGRRLFLTGRAADLIHVAGRKVSPESIERILCGHPAVRECMVLGLPAEDVVRGEVIGAVVVMGAPVTEDALREYLGVLLPAWQVPREWRFVDSLEPDGRGKLSRRGWRLRFLERK